MQSTADLVVVEMRDSHHHHAPLESDKSKFSITTTLVPVDPDAATNNNKTMGDDDMKMMDANTGKVNNPDDNESTDKLLPKLAVVESTPSESVDAKELSADQEKDAWKQTLQEKEDQVSELQRNNHDLVAEVAQLKQEVIRTEEHLNKSYNETLDCLTANTTKLEDEVVHFEQENQDLRFKLHETDRVCKFLQQKVETEMQSHEAYKVSTTTQISELTSQLTEAQRVCNDLQTKLDEAEQKPPVDDSTAQISDLTFQLTEAQQVCQYMEEKMAEAEANYAAKLTDANSQLAQAQRVSKSLQAQLNSPVVKEETQVMANDKELYSLEYEFASDLSTAQTLTYFFVALSTMLFVGHLTSTAN